MFASVEVYINLAVIIATEYLYLVGEIFWELCLPGPSSFYPAKEYAPEVLSIQFWDTLYVPSWIDIDGVEPGKRLKIDCVLKGFVDV